MKHNKNVNVKIVAYYLPQYHQIPENDMWWGEGFTEWTTVKNALPLWYGHKQPKVPFNDYYYDLTERSTMDWQAGLMKHYGIDGWCLYHYWFKDGEKILETPAENLLKWKDIDISYCFCWANESWARTWSNLTDKNSWGEIVETEDKKPGDSGILLKQSYGLEEEWTDHFYYLLPFFQDKRYIRIDNKPIFVIYKPAIIPCLLAMKDCWDELAKDAGLGGICLIYLAGKDEAFDKDVQYAQRSPFSSECLTKIDKCGVRRYSYDKTWESILSNNNKKCFYTGFSGFDDTPRRGVYGSVFDGASPQKLQSYMISMLSKSASEGKEFVFFNAWNEWGEGMYLEPDKENGFKMLEAVKNAKSLYMTNSNVMVPLYTENKEKQIHYSKGHNII